MRDVLPGDLTANALANVTSKFVELHDIWKATADEHPESVAVCTVERENVSLDVAVILWRGRSQIGMEHDDCFNVRTTPS